MPYLRPMASQQLFGPISTDDAHWLLAQLEHDESPTPSVYLDLATIDLLRQHGASAELLENLTATLEGHDANDVEILVDLRASRPFGVAAVEDTAMSLDRIDEQAPTADVYIGSTRLVCQVCKHPRFRHRRALVHSAVATAFNAELLSPSADCYICGQCGFVHWFLPS